MMSQRCCSPRDPQIHAWVFCNAQFTTARFGTCLATFGTVMYQINWFISKDDFSMMNRDYEIGGTPEIFGFVSRLGTTRSMHWLILEALSCFWSLQAFDLMLKCLSLSMSNKIKLWNTSDYDHEILVWYIHLNFISNLQSHAHSRPHVIHEKQPWFINGFELDFSPIVPTKTNAYLGFSYF